MVGDVGLGICFVVGGLLVLIFPIFFLKIYKKFVLWPFFKKGDFPGFDKHFDEKGMGRKIIFAAGLIVILIGIYTMIWGWF
jgi:hypothetical protein